MVLLEEQKITNRSLQKTIEHYGYAPEHNICWYEYSTEPNYSAHVATWPDNTALLTHRKDDEWYIFSEPLAPQEKGADRVVEFISHAFSEFPIKKVWLELREPLRKCVLELLPDSFRANPTNYTLTWPIMNMEAFDPELPGKRWKSIRNARNKFYREHSVLVEDAPAVPKEDLHGIVERWSQLRLARDRAYTHSFHAIIDSGFKGTTTARVLLVDGKPCGINAGWEIPNSDCYYGAIGLHDYSQKDLGLVWYLDDLVLYKRLGYKYVDMAGGEKALTAFKNQFGPEYSYKTFVFSVVKG